MKSQQWLQLGVLSNKLSHINSHFVVRLNHSNESDGENVAAEASLLNEKKVFVTVSYTPHCNVGSSDITSLQKRGLITAT